MVQKRVLVVYGSESGTAKGAIKRITAEWMKKEGLKFTVADTMEGNAAAEQFSTLKDNYNVILVACSSFGDGYPPSGYEDFLKELYKARDKTFDQDPPLDGMQHAVLGFGSTIYETFQNNPRLTDKLLEECGSRRFAKRGEVDDTDEEGGKKTMETWSKEVFECLQDESKMVPGSAPVCKFDEPAGTVQDKDVGQGAVAKGNNEMANYMMYFLVVLVVALAVWYQKTKDAASA
mmetsp:Transcript_20419/g.36827  ORF Transcript_20419/g.36827 Transcript_20419/m.36827 type:complete len:233 (-) Transcript_20419:31-729(-)|eukprot:CAMPEP_0205916244 /NCGR_PEP_ID=MMETSP1325-20131115/8377_1 /ASSEMBLY_ACC=CAM_ASM_000708 /TAXON_ID=236786 /ORGANISM="Florenciella sp., Strain RCC1007" /LENGTH=232 /DNA_ID=CAMNT_0053283497 /DNA_START=112 /DNA_END=810 /DNA_ORIENTATION=-